MTPIADHRWPERFWAKVDKTETCWLWTASTQKHGYGIVGLDGSTRLAHRVAYELEVATIPDGLTLDHLCRTRNCVNPQHLEPVTNAENVARGISPSARNSRKTTCIRGHILAGDNVVVLAGGRRNCAKCRLKHQVDRLARLRAETAKRQAA